MYNGHVHSVPISFSFSLSFSLSFSFSFCEKMTFLFCKKKILLLCKAGPQQCNRKDFIEESLERGSVEQAKQDSWRGKLFLSLLSTPHCLHIVTYPQGGGVGMTTPLEYIRTRRRSLKKNCPASGLQKIRGCRCLFPSQKQMSQKHPIAEFQSFSEFV